MSKTLDLVGKKFGNLYVECFLYSGGRNKCKMYLCRCDCGNMVEKSTTELTKKRNNISCSAKCVLHRGKYSSLFTGYEDISGWYWSGIKDGADERKLEFNLDIKDAWRLYLNQDKKCALTKVPISFAIGQFERSEQTASLDRIDSSKGYTIDNVQWIHKDVNFMKNDFSQERFLEVCKHVYEQTISPDYAGVGYSIIKELNYNNIYLVPSRTQVESRSLCNTSAKLGLNSFLIPVYPSNMKSVIDENTCIYLYKKGLFYTMHRFGVDNEMFIQKMHDIGAFASISVGLNKNKMDDLVNLKPLNPEYITIDIANAWNAFSEKRVKYIKDNFPNTFLIVGNVATAEAVNELQEWGADAIKVGIAGGHVCITKDKTGFHRPMVTTLLECSRVSKVPLIADGGISTNGDVAKAIACGASMVMAGTLFAGYDESAGNIIEIDNHKHKEYFGSASEFNKEEKKNIEGKKILVDYKGSMDKLLKELKEDLQSAISYSGGTDLSDLAKARIIEVS